MIDDWLKYIYNEILLSHKKIWNIAICDNKTKSKTSYAFIDSSLEPDNLLVAQGSLPYNYFGEITKGSCKVRCVFSPSLNTQHILSFFIVVWIQLSLIPHHHFPTPPPTLNPTPLWLCPWVLYTCSLTTLSLLSPLISLPSGYCQYVLYFNI